MEKQKHSGLGIASFILSIASAVFIFLLVAIAGIIEASNPTGMDEESAAAVMIGLFLFIFLGGALVALGLGIAGLFQKERQKIFAILGVVFSVVTLLGTVLLIMIGLSMG
ncbi:hypothetical protein JCM30760_14230 [Thiomicrorhabdus hydrogeniphila]